MKPLVGIIMGSDSDAPIMQEAAKTLQQFGVEYEIGVYSAHRSPHRTNEYVRSARERGLKIDHRRRRQFRSPGWRDRGRDDSPGHRCSYRQFAAYPGFDALLATVQMPPGVPVSTMGVGKSGAINAAILAVEILALSDDGLAAKARRLQSETRSRLLRRRARRLRRRSDRKADVVSKIFSWRISAVALRSPKALRSKQELLDGVCNASRFRVRRQMSSS